MTNQQILVVAPAGWDQRILDAWCYYSLVFRYVKECPSDGLSAWPAGSGPDGQSIDVAAHCHGFSGGFGQHALNRLFSQALMRCRPKVVVIVGLSGCTVDLLRVTALLGVPAVLLLNEPVEPPDSLSDKTQHWLRTSLAACTHILPVYHGSEERWPTSWLNIDSLADEGDLPVLLEELLQQAASSYSYDYAIYEFCQRDHPLLVQMQRGDTVHFEGCSRVLDLACGVGIFLDCLRDSGIRAEGVEYDARIAEYARGMGLNVSSADALTYLEKTDVAYDGIYCSHFVEHIPVAQVQLLLEMIYRRLTPGGVLVLVFPDPESIRSQLLGFWRDPEHVRFYHPDLIASMAANVGLELAWSSYEEQPHHVVPFPQAPPQVSASSPLPTLAVAPDSQKYSLGEKLLQKLGLITERRFIRLEQRLELWSAALEHQSQQYVTASDELEKRTSMLWDVNQTWAWNDNVTLKLTKRSA